MPTCSTFNRTLEYTFRNTTRDSTHTLLLSDHNLTVRTGNEETSVPYAHITRVRLCRASRDVFTMTIAFGGKRLIVTNQLVTAAGTVEDLSRQYATFVRVLHFHLKDKSKAVYQPGRSRKKLLRSAFAATMGSVAICFAAHFFNAGVLNLYIDAVILTAISITLIAVLQRGAVPKDYSAENIPLELLPPA